MSALPAFIALRLPVFAVGCLLGGLAGWYVASSLQAPAPLLVEAPGVKVAMAAPDAPVEARREAPVEPGGGADAEPGAESPEPPGFTLPPLPQVRVMPAVSVEDASGQMEALLRLASEEQRVTLWQEMLGMITPENFEHYYAAWKQGVARRGSPEPQNTMFNRKAGQVAGAEVVGGRDGTGSRDMMGANTFVREQFLGWIQTDAVAAERWLDGLKHPEFRAAMEQAWDLAADEAEAARSGDGK